MTLIQKNLIEIKNAIIRHEKKYAREIGSVSLLAVSKGQSIEKIKEAYDAGQRSFGENYLKEALSKMEALSDLPIEWHFIGSVQNNKTRKIAAHFSWVQSVDHIKIAERLNAQRPNSLPPLNICIEVNISEEATKSGVAIAQVLPLASACLSLPRLKLRGLMAIPSLQKTVEEQRQSFHQLELLWQSLREKDIPLDTLSIGMSHDFEAAIAEGATLVRIGTAIFGERTVF